MKIHKLREHARGHAFVRYHGKNIYFGRYGTEEAQRRYQNWLSDAGLDVDGSRKSTILTLCAKFMRHAEQHYLKGGMPTGETGNFKQTLRVLCKLFGNSMVADFGPKRLKAVQLQMIETGWARTTINASVRRIRHVFKWGVSEQLVTPGILTGLQSVQGLSAIDRTCAWTSGLKGPDGRLPFCVFPHESGIARRATAVQVSEETKAVKRTNLQRS